MARKANNRQRCPAPATPAERPWIDTPRSTAEQIEVSLRRGNTEKQAQLDAVIVNANFAIANSDNSGIKLFAGVMLRLAGGEKLRTTVKRHCGKCGVSYAVTQLSDGDFGDPPGYCPFCGSNETNPLWGREATL